MEPLLDATEVARLLGVSRQHVYGLREAGLLPAVGLLSRSTLRSEGHSRPRLRFDPATVEEYVRRCRGRGDVTATAA